MTVAQASGPRSESGGQQTAWLSKPRIKDSNARRCGRYASAHSADGIGQSWPQKGQPVQPYTGRGECSVRQRTARCAWMSIIESAPDRRRQEASGLCFSVALACLTSLQLARHAFVRDGFLDEIVSQPMNQSKCHGGIFCRALLNVRLPVGPCSPGARRGARG